MSSNEYQQTIEETEHIGEHTVNYKIRWIIPKFKLLMQSKTMTRQFGTKKQSTVSSNHFLCKMSFHGIKNELFDIHYSYRLRSNSTIILKHTSELNIFYTSLKTVDYHRVHANQWQHCANYETANISRQCDADTSLHICIDFQVCVKAEDYFNIIPTPQLSYDFENLLTDGSYSDVTMKSSEGVEFKVHKNIICIRSKVLKAHFEHNTSESITNVVETTWETEVLREVLTFVYTDKCLRIEEFPEKLLAAADYYQLERLKRICAVELTKKLTVENAIEMLQLADLHSAYWLTDSTLDFIKNKRANLIIESQGWENLQSVELLKIMYKSIIPETTSNNILTIALKEISSDPGK